MVMELISRPFFFEESICCAARGCAATHEAAEPMPWKARPMEKTAIDSANTRLKQAAARENMPRPMMRWFLSHPVNQKAEG